MIITTDQREVITEMLRGQGLDPDHMTSTEMLNTINGLTILLSSRITRTEWTR